MSRFLRVLVFNVVLLVLVFAGMRVAFWVEYHDPSDALSRRDLLEAFYLGLKFDLRLALLVNLPFALLAPLRWLSPFRPGRSRKIWLGYFGVASALLLLVYGVDFGHYGYLESRIDASVLRYLLNPSESAGVLWASYPVIRGLGALGLAVAGYVLLLRKLFSGETPAPVRRPLALRIGVVTAAVLVYALGIYGKISYYPLRWSDAYFSTVSFASALSLNPVLYFYETLDNTETDFDEAKVRDDYATMSHYLGVENPDLASLDFTRIAGQPEGKKPLNVVIVLLESFAYYKTGLSGNPMQATPNFDAIAKDGVLFRRCYTPHSGTARSVFASVTGLPDIDSSSHSTRNPLIARQNTLFNAFEGWDKFYFIGGSASWGNIRALLSHNVDGIDIREEGSFTAPRVDMWGISDLSLFEEANKVLSQPRTRPFLAFIQTAGNHKPHTIPDDNRGFVRSPASQKQEAKRYGFDSLAELDSERFIDHAIGIFLDEARKQPYFDDTIFVFYGDHGSPASAEHRPLFERQLSLPRYHVPLVMYSPKHLQPRVIDEVASELDVLPTVVNLAGASGVNSTIGRDLFDPAFAGRRYAFTIERIEKDPLIGLVTGDFYFQMAADGSEKALHRLDSKSPRADASAEEPETAAQLEAIVSGLYETARYMRYHNAPEAVAAQRSHGLPAVASGAGQPAPAN